MPNRLLPLLFLLLAPAARAAERLPLEQVRLPPGFAIELFARVPNARQMALGRHTLFVGSMAAGQVHAIPLRDGKPGRPVVLLAGLDKPVGVAFRDGDLYVSAVSRILRLPGIEARLARPPAPEVVGRYPGEAHHGWKFIAFGPDGWLYVPVGAPCNICQPDPERHAVITRLDPATGRIQVVARGVRNSVGFDWHPRTRELWFTDNGRDWLGDDAPPDELNRLDRPGHHFGYPHCHGAALPDPDFNAGRDCRAYTPPARELGAHVAALGMRFYAGDQFPPEYRAAVFIAEHGSWNRSRKTGYRVGVALLEGNRVVDYRPFASGWLQGDAAWGRPSDVLVLPDGSLLVADDLAGAIYRIRHGGARGK